MKQPAPSLTRTGLLIKFSGQGFTLIEVLIASTIIAFAAGSVMMIGRSSIRNYDSGLERTQAYLLVQEGLEIVRSIRDNQSLDKRSNDWATFLPTPSSATYHPAWDASSGRYRLLAGGEELQPDTRVNLRFTRSITFVSQPTLPALVGPDGTVLDRGIENNTRRVVVEVQWNSNGVPTSVTGTTLLSNWQPED